MGSYPPSQKGLHLNILFTVSQRALKGPKAAKACKEYSEQLGVNLQVPGRIGEISKRYNFIKETKKKVRNFKKKFNPVSFLCFYNNKTRYR